MSEKKLTIEEKLYSSIIAWVPFERGASILCVNTKHAVVDYLLNKGCAAEWCGIEDISSVLKKQFDYIIALEVVEYSRNPAEIVKRLKSLLVQDGTLYLGTDNRLGLRYFCGDVEPVTGHSFVAIEDYNSINNNNLNGRLYSRNEIEAILRDSGIVSSKFYSVLPNLNSAQLIYADGYEPHERLATRYMPMYRNPSSIFAREEWMYDSIIANGMFHTMANSYLIEIHSDKGTTSDVLHVTLSADRGEENSCATIIYKDKVEKRGIYEQGNARLQVIRQHDEDLSNHGVNMIDSCLENDVYVMPRIEAEILEKCLQRLLRVDKEKFLEVLDRYRDVIYSSSDIICSDDHGPILKRCYIDLVPLNCFYKDDDFIFYDQEFYIENEAANLIMWRALVIIYDGNPTLNDIIPISKLMDRYGITSHAEEYATKSGDFLRGLRNQEELAKFNSKNLRDISKVMDNRRKVERALIDWNARIENLKETCFDNLECKNVYIFGSGRFADEFVCMYRYDYAIAGVIDNNVEKHGTEFYGLPISSAEILCDKNPESYKVIVCVKDCTDILIQLTDMGVNNIGVYDIHYFYPGRQKYIPGNDGLASYQEFYKAPSAINSDEDKKKYHIGYIAGVFDLYHLGHLNMFRRAKEMCDYLIVGVVSDEGVRINKRTEPFIPFEERIEVVRSCKYVDEAVEIPFVYCRTPEAFRKYHFDVQFSGSDYANDPGWLSMKEYLEANGATMEFFSYTEQTSSTKIKAVIDNSINKSANVEEKKHKVGYCMASIGMGDLRQYNWLKNVAQECEKFILAIPSDSILANISNANDVQNYSGKAEELANYWSDVKWIDHVEVIDNDSISYRNAYEKYKFDLCCFGSYYGLDFVEDKAYLENYGVEFVSVVPDNLGQMTSTNALKLFLKNNRTKKIVLFGTGVYFDYYMNLYGKEFVPSFAVNNNHEKWGSEKLGIRIENPEILQGDDDVAVIMCAKQYSEMLEQLSSYGISNCRALLYRNELALMEDYKEYRTDSELAWDTLAKVQEINYDMLEIFNDICRKHGIEYCLNYGSLIGTLRHQGFIPWDNDVDTIMTRDNCDKLYEHREEFPSELYYWLDPMTLGKKKYFDCIPRIGYKQAYTVFEDSYCEFYENLYNGIHLDMFLIDKTYDDWRGWIQRKELAVLYGLMNAYRHPKFFEDYPPKQMRQNQLLCLVGRLIPLQWMQKKANRIARRFNKRKDANYYFISNDSLRMLGILFPIEDFDHVVDAPFGRINSMVYNGADHICRMNFGDYMQLPPEEARVPHMGRVMMKADDFVFVEPRKRKNI